ncbi:MAG: hypothetical protein Q7S74_05950 [Nanoarchaeota archaeon]|nr:hypothetical protein [Nanoarchaeota archaeon]
MKRNPYARRGFIDGGIVTGAVIAGLAGYVLGRSSDDSSSNYDSDSSSSVDKEEDTRLPCGCTDHRFESCPKRGPCGD